VEVGVEEAVLEVRHRIANPAGKNLLFLFPCSSHRLLEQANEDDDVDGIMVYYPIFGGQQVSYGRMSLCRPLIADDQLRSQDQYIQQVVSPLKDVEGLHHQFLFNLYHK
jgi:hypothetical protein